MRNCSCNSYYSQNNNSNFNNYSNITNGNSNIYDNNFNHNNAFPNNYLYGHAYTPVQNLNKTYVPEVGLENGTIFPELVSPYCPGQSMDFINYLRSGGTRYE